MLQMGAGKGSENSLAGASKMAAGVTDPPVLAECYRRSEWASGSKRGHARQRCSVFSLPEPILQIISVRIDLKNHRGPAPLLRSRTWEWTWGHVADSGNSERRKCANVSSHHLWPLREPFCTKWLYFVSQKQFPSLSFLSVIAIWKQEFDLFIKCCI